MAIAYDAASTGTATTTSPLTWSHTCTGSDRILFVGVNVYVFSSPECTGVTYNGVAMTLVGSRRETTFGINEVSLWYLINPASGSNTVSVSFTGGTGVTCIAGAVSYTGVDQTSQPDAVSGGTGSMSTPTRTVTTVADKCWVIGVLGTWANDPTPDLTERCTGAISSGTFSLQDTNGPKTPAGGQAVSWTGSSTWAIQAASFDPYVITKTLTADAIVRATGTKTLTSNAIVKVTTTKTLTADGLMVDRYTKTLTSDGVVKATLTSTLTADAFLEGSRVSFTADGVISIFPSVFSGGYTLYGLSIPRPTKMDVENILNTMYFNALSGKTTKDYMSKKKKYILIYEKISNSVVGGFFELINLNIPILFSANDQNLTIPETYVYPEITTREYSKSADYWENVTLVLTET
jgi:hypothetical protein